MAKHLHVEDGFKVCAPAEQMVVYTTIAGIERGRLLRVQILGRAEALDDRVNHRQAWAWKWLTGPRKGEYDSGIRTFWQRE